MIFGKIITLSRLQFIWFLLIGFVVNAQVTYQNQILSIKHPHFQKMLKIPDQESGQIKVEITGQYGQNLLARNSDVPFFEFVIDHHKVTSQDPLWTYDGFQTRAMQNGGTEVTIFIKGTKEPVLGLKLAIYQQFFPESTLIREKLVLMAQEGITFSLNKFNEKLHLIFPQYGLQTNHQPMLSTEIRMASWAAELIDFDESATFDERYPKGQFDDHNLAHNHMYHPKVVKRTINPGNQFILKGPLGILYDKNLQWIMAYEHASQDDLRGLFRSEMVEDGGMIRDASQGTKGIFNFPISSSDFHFLGLVQEMNKGESRVGLKALRGAYLDGEKIDHRHPYSTVWSASAFSHDTSFQASQRIIRDYLWRYICEKPASRKAEFYYNTWGMQRRLSSQGHDLRGVFTEENIILEIRRAAELGVDIFVLDDGWEQTQGDWTPHKTRLPNGLAPIKAALDKYGIKMGIWLSPMGIDQDAPRYQANPEWVILDSEENPIRAQWNHPAFDFVSDFYNLFISDCKKLIDAGARFFKWDAINTFYSTLPDLHHGSGKYSSEEIRARYEYLLPVYVIRAMKELTDYEPDLVIEIDLTEARRVMTGLAPLSQGKLFWMNNGASSYNDYTVFRAKSMRSIPNQFAGLIPLELFTYANYPHNSRRAQRYNVNTSLIAGHGFWGALAELDSEERQQVGKTVRKCKRILPFIEDVITEVTGRVGGSPEIYTQINRGEGAGQVMAFSGQALEFEYRTKLNTKNVLGVLNHAYHLDTTGLQLNFQFSMPDATREAFIIPNEGIGISMVYSTSWIDDLFYENGELHYLPGAPGEQYIRWPKDFGVPIWNDSSDVNVQVTEEKEAYYLKVNVLTAQSLSLKKAK